MDSSLAPSLLARSGSTRLDHLGIIEVGGPDAARFLHAQLTNDVLSQDATRARLTGYCSPRGRLLATAVILRSASDTFLLVTARDILGATVKRLSMFVLRSKLTLADRSAVTSVWGLTGVAAGERVATSFGPLPSSPYAMAQKEGVCLVALPPAMGLPRWLAVVAADSTPPWMHEMSGLSDPGASFWRWLEIRAGIPTVTAKTQEKFVPQMINFEALGGVDFDKGCYPGQEVVARSQYLGRLKRRMMLANVDAAAPHPEAGSDLFTADSPEPCGVVVAAEPSPLGGIDLLVELPVDAHPPEGFHVADSRGPLVILLPLPYDLPDHETFVRPKL